MRLHTFSSCSMQQSTKNHAGDGLFCTAAVHASATCQGQQQLSLQRTAVLQPSAQLSAAYLCASLSACPADFTNLVSQMHLQDLAEADAAKEQVQQVQVRQLSARRRLAGSSQSRSAAAVGVLDTS
jgi:hypothetical protein